MKHVGEGGEMLRLGWDGTMESSSGGGLQNCKSVPLPTPLNSGFEMISLLFVYIIVYLLLLAFALKVKADGVQIRKEKS